MSDGVIGSVRVTVSPDADNFWRDLTAQTSGEADAAGRKAGEQWQHGFDQSVHGAKIKVDADTSKARAQIAAVSDESKKAQFQANVLRDALIALGPAAVPIGAVVGGALAGAIPTLATLALGVRGVSQEFQSGALNGTVYAGEIRSLSGEFATLQSIASAGALTALNDAMRGSGPLFKSVNTDTAELSAQLGTITGDTAPALLSLLEQLSPLFVSFGTSLSQGAAELRHFAESGTGVSSFVAYAQSQLPGVEHTLGELAVAAAHLTEGLEPMGGVAVTELGLLSHALAAVPVDVLKVLETGALTTYSAFRVYGAVSALIDKVSAAQQKLAASASAATLRQEAASAAASAASKEEAAQASAAAAEVARAKAAEAQAAAESAAAVVASSDGVASLFGTQADAAQALAASMTEAFGEIDSLFASEAEVAAATASSVVSSLQAQAEEATLAATQQAEASAAAAEASKAAAAAVKESSVASRAAWVGALGPIAAVATGVGLLVGLFHQSNAASVEATQAAKGYLDALTQGGGRTTILDTIVKQLSDNGVPAKIASLNADLGVVTREVVDGAPA